MYNSYQIANYFIKKGQDSGIEITPMKLIKLTYIAHGWYLGYYGEQLLDESVYAWKYGPVIDTLYQAFKKYGNSPITELYVNEENGRSYPFPDTDVMPFLDAIWKAYGPLNGIQLSALTHQPGTPWDKVWNNLNARTSLYAPIPNNYIQEHYSELIAQRSTNKNAKREPVA